MNQSQQTQLEELRRALDAALRRQEEETAARLAAERALALASEERAEEPGLGVRCLEIASLVLLALDRDGRVTLINPRGLEILGCSAKEEVLGKNWFEHFVRADLRASVVEVFRALLRGELIDNERWENAVQCRNGEERIIAWHNFLLRDDQGSVSGILCSGQDVTEMRRAEQALRARERQQAAVARLGQRALTSTDFQALLEMAARSIAEVLEVEFCKFLELRAEGADLLLRAGVGWRAGLVGRAVVGAGRDSQAGFTLASNHPVIVEDLRTETRFTGPDLLRDHAIVSGLSCAIAGPGGRAWGVLGAHTAGRRAFSEDDINFLLAVANIVAAVVARGEANRILRERDADLRRAQALGHIGSWRLDVRSNELTWSAETHRIFGVPQGTRLTYDTFLSLVHPEDRDRVDRTWQKGLHAPPYAIEHRLLVGGTVKWVRELAELEFNEDGSLRGAFGTTQDITERKRSEEALKEADRQKDEFLAMLAHELRNPLTPILNAAEVIAMLQLDEPRLRWAQEVIERQVQHLSRLVDDLLDVSRIVRGKITLRRRPLDLRAVVRQAAEDMRPAIEAKGQHLELNLPQVPVPLAGDPVRLVQVLVNALDNASKYSPKATRVELSVETTGEEALVRVRDQGEGITPELLPRVFDLFRQGERTLDRRESGLGIGLTLVRRLVEEHGGRVAVESLGLGQGTSLTISLPLAQGAAPLAPDTPAAAATGGPALRVLVVDDERFIAKSMAMVLRGMGHDVRLASCGEEALQEVPAFRPQVVLLDIGLPGMDGWETARALRRLPEAEGTRVVAITGYGDETARLRSQAAGFDEHLVKPVAMAQLEALFARCAEAAGSAEPDADGPGAPPPGYRRAGP